MCARTNHCYIFFKWKYHYDCCVHFSAVHRPIRNLATGKNISLSLFHFIHSHPYPPSPLPHFSSSLALIHCFTSHPHPPWFTASLLILTCLDPLLYFSSSTTLTHCLTSHPHPPWPTASLLILICLDPLHHFSFSSALIHCLTYHPHPPWPTTTSYPHPPWSATSFLDFTFLHQVTTPFSISPHDDISPPSWPHPTIWSFWALTESELSVQRQPSIVHNFYVQLPFSFVTHCAHLALLVLIQFRSSQLYLKGTVRQDARWVENGLKCCVLTNYITASLLFFLNWICTLMNVRYKCCTVLSSAGVGLISKLNWRGQQLQNKVIMSSQLQYNCC